MLRTVQAVISANGDVQLLEAVQLPGTRRALVTIMEDDAPPSAAQEDSIALWSEAALAADWLREEEDDAWAHLQEAAHPQAQAAGQEPDSYQAQ